METERNEAYLLLENGQILTNTGRLIGLAKNCKYEIGKERKEGTEIRNQEGVLTVVPRHREINRNTARGIMQAYATGQSSFKRYRVA